MNKKANALLIVGVVLIAIILIWFIFFIVIPSVKNSLA